MEAYVEPKRTIIIHRTVPLCESYTGMENKSLNMFFIKGSDIYNVQQESSEKLASLKSLHKTNLALRYLTLR